jgi:perosamine synthetase
LEREFAAFVGAPFMIGVNSGSSALLASLTALGVGAGDEVALPAYTFIADLLAVLHAGARPVFVDVLPGTYGMDPDDFARRVTTRTKAVIVVHLFGRPAEVQAIGDIAGRRGIRVVEDCCQAHGAMIGDRMVGSFGDLACFSFSQGHILSGGTGGAVLTGDPALAKAVRELRFFGVADIEAIDLDDDRDYASLGFNYALNEISAGLVRVQLPRIGEIIDDRAAVARAYAQALDGVDTVESPAPVPDGQRSSHHLVPVRVGRGARFGRRELAGALRKREVGFLTTYPRALHQVSLRRPYQDGPFAVSEDLAQRTIGLFAAGSVTPQTAAATAEKVRDAVLSLS